MHPRVKLPDLRCKCLACKESKFGLLLSVQRCAHTTEAAIA